MPSEDPWITIRIGEARKCHPSVNEAVTSRMKKLLEGQLSEQQLSQKELRNIAILLITDMVPAQSKTDMKQ